MPCLLSAYWVRLKSAAAQVSGDVALTDSGIASSDRKKSNVLHLKDRLSRVKSDGDTAWHIIVVKI